MGCDFYEILYLKIEYTDVDGFPQKTHEKLSTTRRYIFGTVDSDSEDAFDRQLQEEMERTEKSYGKKIIYENGQWKITSKDSINQYSRCIPQGATNVTMTKYVICEER